MQMRERPNLFFAGQITGVEGYVESVAMGWLAGVNAARLASGLELLEAPARSATGSLAHYVSHAEAKNFQPVNITFALLPPLPEPAKRTVRKKRERRQLQVDLALKEWAEWLEAKPHKTGSRSRRLSESRRGLCSCASDLLLHVPCLRGVSRAGKQDPEEPETVADRLQIRTVPEAQFHLHTRPKRKAMSSIPTTSSRSARTLFRFRLRSLIDVAMQSLILKLD